MSKFFKSKKIMWIISVIPLILTGIAIQFMPDSVPMHYDMSGKIDRYGSKYENIIFPIFILLITLFWQIFIIYYEKKALTASTDKERHEAASNAKCLIIVSISTSIVFGIMQCFILFGSYFEATKNSTHASIDIAKVSCILLGVLYIILGNYMPKTKKNGTIGVRISWSMYNDVTWAKSNHFGAIALIITGLLTIITSIFVSGNLSTILMLIYLAIAVVAILIYSYDIYRDECKSRH